MSSFLAALEGNSLDSPGTTKIDDFLFRSGIDEDLRDDIIVALIDPRFPTARVWRELIKKQCNVGETTVRRYRTALWLLLDYTPGEENV